MNLLKVLKNIIEWIVEAVQDVLVPENSKIRGFLELSPSVMRSLLPKSPVYSGELFVLFDYQNQTVRLIVKSIKYKNNKKMRERIAAYLYEELIEISSEIALFHGNPPVLIPMPMSKKEKRGRGFNQCEEMATEIKNLAGGNVEVSYDVLRKIRETERQTKLSREKREQNLKDSMSVSGPDMDKVSDRVCIVLDDVYTTGASIEEARRALLSAGAKRVLGLFLAH